MMHINRLPNTSPNVNIQPLRPRYNPPNQVVNMGINQDYISQIIQLLRSLLAALQGSNPPPNTTPALTVTQSQRNNALELLGYNRSAPFTVTIKDMDGSGTISQGDVVIINGGITGGEINRRTLSATDAKALNTPTTNTGTQTLQANQAKWNDLAKSGNYDFTVVNGGFRVDGGRPVNISVRNGAITNATYADTGAAAADYSRVTMKDLFDQIQAAYNNNAEQINIQYDPATGAPSSIAIDHSTMIADEETAYTISNIKILP